MVCLSFQYDGLPQQDLKRTEGYKGRINKRIREEAIAEGNSDTDSFSTESSENDSMNNSIVVGSSDI